MSLASLKREVAIISKALNVNVESDKARLEKDHLLNELLIEFSRICDTDSSGNMIAPDPEALEKWNLKVEAFNASHPPSKGDLTRLNPIPFFEESEGYK